MADPGKDASALTTGNGIVPQVKTATVIGTANGTLVSGVSGAKITPLALYISTNTASTLITLKDGSTTVASYQGAAYYPVVAPAGAILFRGSAATALNFTLNAANNTAINIVYYEDTAN